MVQKQRTETEIIIDAFKKVNKRLMLYPKALYLHLWLSGHLCMCLCLHVYMRECKDLQHESLEYAPPHSV